MKLALLILTARQRLGRIVSIEPVILAVLAVATFSTWGFIEIAGEVLEGDTDAFDRWAVEAMREPGNPRKLWGPPWVEIVGRDATALGGVAWLTFTTVVIAIFLWLCGDFQMMVFMLAATASGAIASLSLKWLFGRPRPDVVPHLTHVATASFPSGHAMLSAVVYLTLGSLLAALVPSWKLKIYVIAVACVLSIAVGVSRAYLGVHYPTDVLAGWLAGLVWALACWLVARWLQRRGSVERQF